MDRSIGERFLFVFIGEIPEGEDIPAVNNPARREYLEGLSNPSRRRESAYVWRLLERGIAAVPVIRAKFSSTRRLPTGRWVADGLYLSVSHTSGVCAAAVSSSPVGVDIELIREPRAESFARRVLTHREYAEYESLEDGERVELLIKKWTCLESIFKAGLSDSIMDAHRLSDAPVHTEALELSGRRCCLSVCSDTLDMLKKVYINDL